MAIYPISEPARKSSVMFFNQMKELNKFIWLAIALTVISNVFER
jgi:heme exporter protein D